VTSSLKQFKRRALAKPEVKAAYDASADEFAFLDEVLRARAEAGLTQAEVAQRIGTTQSAIARLESAEPKHSPSIATLQKYANALGYAVVVRLVKKKRSKTDWPRVRATRDRDIKLSARHPEANAKHIVHGIARHGLKASAKTSGRS
jgi:transcriptional regulator with XRE-family HTH domain